MSAQTKHPILVVDDEPEILFSLRGLLRREFEVQTAESAQEAMEILQQQPIHVVMTDQRMPAMTGVELLSRVQGEWPDAIRMVFTGYADVKAVIDAINEGHIYRYITKPWDPDELRALLRQACEEYDRIIERRQLLTDLHAHQEQCMAFLQGRPDAERLVEAARGLRDRLARALAAGAHRAGMENE